MKVRKKGFTLVELIIVIIILIILASIAYLTLRDYPGNARDAERKADLSNIAKTLELYQIEKGKFPQPDGAIKDLGGWKEGDFGSNIFGKTKRLSELPTDPLDSSKKYTYIVSDDGKSFRLKAKLENGKEFVVAGGSNKNLASTSGTGTTSSIANNDCFDFQLINNNTAYAIVNYRGGDNALFQQRAGNGIPNYNSSCPLDVIIPAIYNEKPIVAIQAISRQQPGFSHHGITSLTIPNSITTLGNHVFSYNTITNVTIPNSVTSIGTDAFKNNGASNNSQNITDWTSGNGGTWILNGTTWAKQ